MFTLGKVMVLTEKRAFRGRYSLENLRKDPERVYIEIYREYKKEFLSWGRKFFNANEDDLTDAFQDAIIVLYNNIKQEKLIKLESSLKTYIFGVGKNIILKKQTQRKGLIISGEEASNDNEPDWQEELYYADEIANKVSLLLEEMNEPCKSILKHFYYDNYSMEEIAVILDYKNADTVKSQKLRCIKYLKNALQRIIKQY